MMRDFIIETPFATLTFGSADRAEAEREARAAGLRDGSYTLTEIPRPPVAERIISSIRGWL